MVDEELAFGPFRLSLGRRELLKNGVAVPLGSRAFDLLATLVRRSGNVVSKDELIATIWNGRIVSESALTTAINAARTALGDNGEAQRLIKTLPRKGIRFVGTVSGAFVTPGEAPAETPST